MLASVPVLPQSEGMSHYRQHGVGVPQQMRVQGGQQQQMMMMQPQTMPQQVQQHQQVQQRAGYAGQSVAQQPQQAKTGEEEDDVTAIPVVRSGRSPPEMTRPCTHNAWDDVRTRRHAKILQCRACLAKWKLAMPVPRCSYFLHGHCDKGDTCHMLHVYKKKAEKEKDRQPTEPPVAPRNEKEDRNLADSVKTAPPNGNDHQWSRSYFPEDDINYLARSEGGTKYGIVQLKELKDELSNRRTQRNQNIVQYIQQSSDAHMQHVLVSLVQQQAMPSPTSSAEPPSLMSPASCAPATPITSSGIPMAPPSPINQQEPHPISAQQTSVAASAASKDRSLAVRRGFVQPVASSNPPYYNGIVTPTANGGPVSLENQRQMSMPSLVATPMGTEMLGTPGCHSPHSPLGNSAAMAVPSPTGVYGSDMGTVHEEAPPPYTLLAGTQSNQSQQQQPAPEEIEKQRMIAMASGFAISSGAQPISDIHSHASRHTGSPCNLISPVCQSPTVHTPHCISPVAGCVSPMSGTSEVVKSPVQRENEGVHAMTEDELDAHIANWEKRATPKAC
eukprot:TRINITY_DN1009_c0_g1_i1.p1 TRINITY_DN1009_c0_g1~~TRINITY_DN1009_c0_g1_i1.p1  ORF type:complete len:558 (+),score=151.85 TRINITY_DN1009_c0_g1_i1:51-1724(+)